MSVKVAIILPAKPHPRTKALAEELVEIIPASELASSGDITLSFTEDVGPQFLSLRTPTHQFVFKIIDFKSRTDLGLKTTINKQNTQLILNNFTTEIGMAVAESLMELFDVNLESNQVVNFSVHKGFVYFRIYRFCFRPKGLVTENIGPHITLRLWRMTEYDGDKKKTHCFKKFVKNLNIL